MSVPFSSPRRSMLKRWGEGVVEGNARRVLELSAGGKKTVFTSLG